jgi:lipopolysaccharide/colanic/teichoic acid biosynthesis glycosyltransferase
MKRWFDGVGSLLLLVLTLPILVVVAVGCGLSLRANPLFRHERVGRSGARFQLLKIRTLPRSVPPYIGKYELAEFEIPRFCQAVRNLHLDELPQLVHVVTGRMSLIGPRPEMPDQHERLDPRFAELRTSIRPGCTGLWQVSSASRHLIGEHPEFDEYYVRHRSLRLDLWIAWRTSRKMVPLLRHHVVDFDRLPPWAPPVPGRAVVRALD